MYLLYSSFLDFICYCPRSHTYSFRMSSVIVTGAPEDTSLDQVRLHFQDIGGIVEIPQEDDGFMIEFESETLADRAVRSVQHKTFGASKIEVQAYQTNAIEADPVQELFARMSQLTPDQKETFCRDGGGYRYIG